MTRLFTQPEEPVKRFLNSIFGLFATACYSQRASKQMLTVLAKQLREPII